MNHGVGAILESLPGISCREERLVAEEHTAQHLRERGLMVVSTPSLLLFVEIVARKCLDSRLPEGWVSVGVEALIKHLAPAMVGSKLAIVAELVSARGRRAVFLGRVLRDDGVLVSEVYHERRVVRLEDLIERAGAVVRESK